MEWELVLQQRISDFDLLKCGQIRRICIELSTWRGVDLRLSVVHADTHVVDLHFHDVRNLHLPEMPCGLFELGELSILDVSSLGWENVRYRIGDEISGLAFDCVDIDVASVEKI